MDQIWIGLLRYIVFKEGLIIDDIFKDKMYRTGYNCSQKFNNLKLEKVMKMKKEKRWSQG